MTHAIDATGNVVTQVSALTENNDLQFSARDLTAEKVAKGQRNKATTFIDDEVANNNPDVIIRDGSRQHANGDYQPTDLVLINGMEVPYETAVSTGLIKGDNFISAIDEFNADAENYNEAEAPYDVRSEELKLVEGQLEVALGDKAGEAMELFSNDVVVNGEISDAGLDYAQKTLGMNSDSVQEIVSDLTDAGGATLQSYLDTGDGLEVDRINFLVDLSTNGSNREQSIIRQLWVDAAMGNLSREQAIQRFDDIAIDYS